jgi:phytoene/squalene synthetase
MVTTPGINLPDTFDNADPSLRNRSAAITKRASRQTYYTILFLVDRDRVFDAYRAYAYFRWLDDLLDEGDWSQPERVAFVERQKMLASSWRAGRVVPLIHPEESMLAHLVRVDEGENSGLRTYIDRMLAVMAFDAGRRGRLVRREELMAYTDHLAIAVTEALHYFIGHDRRAPHSQQRHRAAAGAHITHMLRDTFVDLRAGYFNVPLDLLEKHGLTPMDVGHDAYRDWVRECVVQARGDFAAGKRYLAQVEDLRCRLAGFAYIARFEWLLDVIERDGCLIRENYPERRSGANIIRMAWRTFVSTLNAGKHGPGSPRRPRRSLFVPGEDL